MILRPIVPKIPCYIRDTGYFLQILRKMGNNLPPGTLLCTLDVSSLYTNIPNEEGRRAVAFWLSQYRPPSKIPIGEPSNSSILSLIKIVLEFNNFQLNNNHFLQVGGTAMGTRVAPTLANMFMGDFERKHVYTYRLQPLIWARFIDDIFLLWTQGRMELDLFIQHLNRAHQNITFTSEISETQVPFLDTLVIKSGVSLRTDLYTKPTDANNFLHYHSAHPPIVKRAYLLDNFYAYVVYAVESKTSIDMG